MRVSRVSVIAILGAFVFAPALAGSAPAAGSGAAQPLRRVEASKVCMANDKLFGKEQIPVVVDGRTYYGCCQGCKTMLAQNEQARKATDPVSGKTVDKATAVIGAGPDGRVFYFDSENNLEAFRRNQSSRERR